MAQSNVKLKSGETIPFTYPDDWSQEQIETAIHDSFPDDGGNKSEKTDNNISPEGKIDSKSLMSDLMHSLGKSLREGKDFALKAPGMGASLVNNLKENPLSSLKHDTGQLLAGIGETAKDLANTGLSVGTWGLKQLDPLGTKLMERNGKEIEAPQIPEDTGLEKFLGLEKSKKEDPLIRAAPNLYAAGKILKAPVKALVNAFKAPDLKQAIKNTQAKVNAVDRETGKIFDTVEQEVGKNGVSKIPLDKSVIDESERYLANTPANKALIERARTGAYKALRQLQADLRVKGEKALSFVIISENTMGEEMLATRDQVNSAIQTHLEDTGYKDLADMLIKLEMNIVKLKRLIFHLQLWQRCSVRARKFLTSQ